MQKSACFEAARDYLNFNMSVIPLVPNSKRPALESWAEFQHRRPTFSELESWWQDGQQKGVAIVCGQVSGIVVLDIDDPDKFEIALKALGETLPDTPIVQTRKGWHVYFRYPQNRVVRRHDRLADWGSELRGDGCYVVAPPTVIEGHKYHWAKRNGRLMALGQVPIADCPEWLLDAFGVPFADQPQKEPTLSPQPEANGSLSPEQKSALKAILVPHWVEGQRHELALGFAGLLAKSGVTQDEALALLREIADEAQDNEWRDRERALKDTFNRLWKGEQVVGFKRLEEILGDQTTALIANIVRPQTSYKSQPAYPTNGQLQDFKVLTAADLLTLQTEPIPPVIDGLIFKGTLTVFIGETSVGKTTLFYHMAAALAKGENFLNRSITQPYKVLLIDAETPISLAQAKLGDLIDPQDEAATRFYWLRLAGLSADDQQACDRLLETIRQIQPDVVFVDPLNAVMLVEDFNDEAEARKQLLPWKRVADELGCAVILSAHPPKDRSRKGAARWRGSFARAEIVDVAFNIEGNFQSETLTLELVKDRTGCAIGKITLRKVGGFEVVEGADEDAASKWILKFVSDAHNEGKDEVSRAEIVAAAKEAGWSEKTISNRLTALVQTRRLERSRRGFYRLPLPDEVPDFPNPNPLELQEFPDFPDFPEGKEGKREIECDDGHIGFPAIPADKVGEKGKLGNSGKLGTSPEPIYASLRDDELLAETLLLDSQPVDLEAFVSEGLAKSACESQNPANLNVDLPPSPCCGEPLTPDPEGLAVCVGCGRLWRFIDGSWRPEFPDFDGDNDPKGSPDPPEIATLNAKNSRAQKAAMKTKLEKALQELSIALNALERVCSDMKRKAKKQKHVENSAIWCLNSLWLLKRKQQAPFGFTVLGSNNKH